MAEDDLAAALAMSMEPNEASGARTAGAFAVRRLREENTAETLKEANSVAVLTTLLGNLVKNPSEEKFRRVKLSNPKISKALSCLGAQELLLSAGFVKSEELLEVPSSSTPEKVKALSFVAGQLVLAAQLRAEGEVRCVTTLESGGVAFGSMETWLLTSEKDRVGADNLIRVYETLGPPPRLLSGHQRRAGVDGVLALAAVPGTGRLVSAGRDGRIIVWQDGQEVADLKGHGENMEGTNVHVVSALAMTKDGCLISGGWDKTVRLWENQSQKYMMTGHEIAINAVAGLRKHCFDVEMLDLRCIGIWRDGQKLKSLQAKQVVRALCALDGSLLCAGTNDGCMRVWDTNSGQMLAERRVAQSYVLALARRGDQLAAGTSDGQVVILSWTGGELQVKEELQVSQEVALNFARQHGGIAANELPDIANFVQQQVMSMGFPEPLARQALESTAWDVEAAVSRLLG
eukprot:g23743.t1